MEKMVDGLFGSSSAIGSGNRNGVECVEHGVIDCLGIKEKLSIDLLEVVNCFVIERQTGIIVDVLYGCAVIWSGHC